MADMGVVRARCYLILQGLECSIADNLIHNAHVNDPDFLNQAEIGRALTRLREDMQDAGWGLDDVNPTDLLSYLDLGDLLSLLNRHKKGVQNAQESDVVSVTRIVENNGVHAIRKRVMHPVRPLESGDFNTLQTVANELCASAPNLKWTPLVDGMRLIDNPQSIAEAVVPRFWLEESRPSNNLPVPEFEDTGFIGRREERHRVKALVISHHRVITVVGAGGIGKTALAMRVCHDVLDDPSSPFDNLIWVSLKTQFLTVDGIRDISEAVRSQAMLLGQIAQDSVVPIKIGDKLTWEPILEHMRRHKTLLVVDNLETLGSEIRDLAIDIPEGSKLLLTSRVGLGEIELRYAMPDFSPHDSMALMRVLANTYNYKDIQQLSERRLRRYCQRLHHNPLLIKWFVQAVGKGATPDQILQHTDFNDALSFCFENVFNNLTGPAQAIISVLQAARDSLTQPELRALTGVGRTEFDIAMLELKQSNAIETTHNEDGSILYNINGLILDYLSKVHRPKDEVVKKVRETIRQWQVERERNVSAQMAYRYGKAYVLVENREQSIAADLLRETLRRIHSREPILAQTALDQAELLVPEWGEVFRVKAHLLRLEERPIYDVENAFETAIQLGETDINRRDYAAFLMTIQEHDRALDQIEAAIRLETGVENVLMSMRALALTRLGKMEDALRDYEYLWSHRSRNQSRHDVLLQGTQYAEALRRYVEQLTTQLKNDDAADTVIRGLKVVSETATECGWDNKLVEVGVRLLGEKINDLNVASQLMQTAQTWDSDNEFVRNCNRQRAIDQFAIHRNLAEAMPRCSRDFATYSK